MRSVGGESGKDRLKGEDERGVGGRSEALRPGLDDEAGDGSEQGGDGQRPEHGGGEADEAMALGDGDGDEHPEGADGDFDRDQVGKAVVLGAASDDDDLEGEGYGAAKGEEVSAIERGEARVLGRAGRRGDRGR